MIRQVVKKRRSLTPQQGVPAVDGVHQMRRGETRSKVSERITLRGVGEELWEGWALNVSRGGVRCILEEKVELGAEYELTIGVEGQSPLSRRGRVVWLQEEDDGVVVGLEFMNLSGTHRSTLPSAPSDPAVSEGAGPIGGVAVPGSAAAADDDSHKTPPSDAEKQ